MCDVYFALSPHWQAIKNLPIRFGIKMYVHAKNQKIERDIWDMWLIQFGQMDKQSYITFEDYKSKLLTQKQQYTEKSSHEICDEMERIIMAYKGG